MAPRRILHTADWHLGQSFHGYDRAWEHDQFLGWLLAAIREYEADALFVAGDVFDTVNPSSVAQRQWFTFLAELVRVRPQCDVVAIGGNHDSAARLEAPDALTRALGLHVLGSARNAAGDFDPGRLIVPLGGRNESEPWGYVAAIPFLRADDLGSLTELMAEDAPLRLTRARFAAIFTALEERADVGKARLAMAHGVMLGASRSMDSEREVRIGNVEALPVDVFPETLAYVGLGHLHRPQQVGGREGVAYAGSPLPLHTSEADYPHRVVMVEVDGGVRQRVTSLPLPRWVRVHRIPSEGRLGSAEEAVAEVAALPRHAELPAVERPYLEVRYRADAPRPTFVEEVNTALDGKGYRLTTVRAVLPEAASRDAAFHGTSRNLRELDAVDVFRAHYLRRFRNGEPSEALVSAFRSLLVEVDGAEAES